MCRTIRSYTVRMLGIAGFLGVTTLAAPAASHGQTVSPYRAFLNSTAAVSQRTSPIAAAPSPTVDSESALLGRSAFDRSSQPKMAIASLEGARPIDGEQALLNKAARTEAHRVTRARQSK